MVTALIISLVAAWLAIVLLGFLLLGALRSLIGGYIFNLSTRGSGPTRTPSTGRPVTTRTPTNSSSSWSNR